MGKGKRKRQAAEAARRQLVEEQTAAEMQRSLLAAQRLVRMRSGKGAIDRAVAWWVARRREPSAPPDSPASEEASDRG